MCIPVRRLIGTVVCVFALLGPFCGTGQAQILGGFGANAYVNPLGAGFGFNVGGLGYSNLAAGGWGGWGGMIGMGSGGMGAYGGPGFGSGGLGSAALSGAAYGYGWGYGMGLANTQWMMNPYQGYLQGAADITRANAQYQQTIQQARLTRQETIRSSLETRRAVIEEAEWERQHMPDPEKIRQRTLRRELSAARAYAPPTDVWSARALNTLLRHLIAEQADGAKGPRIPLSEDLVKHINVKVGDSVGNIGLLKREGGELDWPEALQGSAFKDSREQINSLMRRAYKSVSSGSNPDPGTLSDLQTQYRKLRQMVDNNVEELKPNEYIEAKRYLDEIGQTVKGLEDPNVGRQFNEKVTSRDVADLVHHMHEKGLMFGPAAGGDEAAYMALYHALVTFDAGMIRPTANRDAGNR
jgi:hypothetical protein